MEGPGPHGGSQGRRLPALTAIRATTNDHLLGGRVEYAQPAEGYRSGIEPVLLAAAIPTAPGERVLEAGSGAGAALLCLAARIPGLSGVGVERDPDLTSIAMRNAAANHQQDLRFIAADIATAADLGRFDHALANPPYHPSIGTASPHAARAAAKRGQPGLFAVWANALAKHLRPRGTLTFVLPAAVLPACLDAFADAGCGPAVLFPLWPKNGHPAKLVLLHGIKAGKTRFCIHPGMILHDANGRFTPQAEAILRHGQQLSL
jgi:tRNA1(Val) A37 N6-methylase TrmN6